MIANARIVDGTGAPAFAGAVRIVDGRIAAVELEVTSTGDTVIDARGLALAPGFIDTHSHADRQVLVRPDATPAVSQGITTLVVGQNGSHRFPLADYRMAFEASPATVNLASYVGHTTLRQTVLGDDFRREATAEEMGEIRRLLETELEAGALGLSTWLEDAATPYPATEEVIELARIAAEAGGRYVSSLRNEDIRMPTAVQEMIRIGNETGMPVHIGHARLALNNLRGAAWLFLGILDEARADGVDITLDVDPWPYWLGALTGLLPDRNFEDLEEARFVVSGLNRPEGFLIATYAPEPAWAGRTLADIAEERGEEPAAVLLDLIRRAEAMRADPATPPETRIESVILTPMEEEDLAEIFAWEHANLSSDAYLFAAHPRGFGSFPRALRRFVRERKVLSLEQAVRRMTSLAAGHMGLEDRGRIAAGMAADLVLFEPETVAERATPEDPHALSVGIHRVLVAGETVFVDGAVTEARPGAFLTRRSARPSAARPARGGAPAAARPGLVITNARIVDGTGAPSFSGAVRIVGGRIAAVGPEVTWGAGDEVIDAESLVLAPGFIDTRSHADWDILDRLDAIATVSQGITTVVVGQNGNHRWPLAGFRAALEATPATVNVASYAGHNTLRAVAMGRSFHREATAEEIGFMRVALEHELETGALGLSTGLLSDPDTYASTGEVTELARVAAAAGGRYSSPLRGEHSRFGPAVREIVRIAEETGMPVQIPNARLGRAATRGEAQLAIELLEAARSDGVDITLSVDPWPYWLGALRDLLQEHPRNLEEARHVLAEEVPPEGVLIRTYAPEPALTGRMLADIAEERGEDPARVLVDLVRQAEAMEADPATPPGTRIEQAIVTSMDEGDIASFFAWEHTNLSSNGLLFGPHPNGFGSFPRALRLFVREQEVLSLEQAVRRMTSLAADHMGFEDRGRIAPGTAADLVLFDPETVAERATPDDPNALSVGIHRVLVAGETVFVDGAVTGARPGAFLARR